jgi:hypothetical protein
MAEIDEDTDKQIANILSVKEESSIEMPKLEILDQTYSVDTPPSIETLNEIVPISASKLDDVAAVSNTGSTEIVRSVAQSLADRLNSNMGNGGEGMGSGSQIGFGGRLSAAGAKSGDVQISLAWDTVDDIDLHVSYTPGNGIVDNINWMNRTGSISMGILDIDMNANSAFVSNTPVENIFWPPNSSPNGFFSVYVHFYRSWTGNTRVPVMVRVKNQEEIKEFRVITALHAQRHLVYSFKFISNKPKNNKRSNW